MRSTGTRLLFAAVLVATLAAFLVTQRLKGSFPLVIRFAANPAVFSPNGDGFRDETTVGFDLTRDARVSFWLIDAEGREVRRLMAERRLRGDIRYRFRWDGRDDRGHIVPDGIYRLRLIARDEGRVIDSLKEIRVDTKPPAVRIVSARPAVVAPGNAVTVRYAGPANRAPEFYVFRTDARHAVLVARFRGHGRAGVWDGLIAGRPAPPGTYAFAVRVRDRAGNQAFAPARVPSPASARPGTGVTVTAIAVSGPTTAVSAGARVGLRIAPADGRRYRFALYRVGSRRPVLRGRARASSLRFRLPRSLPSGVYLLRARRGRAAAGWPLVVRSQALPRFGPRLLVVVPVTSWQAANPADSDANGFPEVIGRRGGVVALNRPYAAAPRLMHELREVAALLSLLRRSAIGFELATDLDLEAGRWLAGGAPSAAVGPGVLVAGALPFAGAKTARALLRHVEAGGRLALLGVDSLHRRCRIAGPLLRCGARRAVDLFGIAAEIVKVPTAPFAVRSDGIRLFGTGERLFGLFARAEVIRATPRGARLLAAAGPPPDLLAFTAYRLGRGLVIRVGTPEWLSRLEPTAFDRQVPRITARVARLVAGG
ncbi:N,N-dimethylformamidase beta subunit family domain-containing protein [Thermoleophilum album]|uniref:FlgD Ig-like domain-containing protein n=1 Tax=Thermoleophilum album TaxID=29539 RepID=A0A1H6FME7_THEAL|nr:N,N-dimethylformamidase beta subunit family domain-containing protein [Thermoleophilum album]SEH10985.1 FlgD Ig-like domain-containing protein [Thermoleophilum album]